MEDGDDVHIGPQPDGHMPVQAQGRNRHRVKQVPDEAAERLNGRDSRRYLSAGVKRDVQRT